MSLPPAPQTIAQIVESRRVKNARILTAALAVGMALAAPVSWLATVASDYVLALVLATAAVLGVAHLLVRRKLVRTGTFVMVGALLVQHVALARDPEAFTVTPFFSSLIVLMAATALPARWLWAAAAASLIAILTQGAIAGVFDGKDTHRASLIGSLFLLAFTTVIAWLQVQGTERGFRLAEQGEERRQRLTRRLQKGSRMEALGRLAGGVAHDFNNFLVVIQGSADLVANELPPDHETQGELERIQQTTGRASDLTTQLLAFSRRQVAAPTLLSPGEILEQSKALLDRLVGPDVSVEIEVADSTSQILASRTQLEQLLFNIAANARDAMPGGGRFSVAVHDRELKKREISGLAPGRYVQITLTDTGTGIPADVKEHMFEPFYSTKGEARGTGLGLATSFGTISQLGGHISVDTEMGKGSSFCVLLPSARPESRRVAPPPPLKRNSERALVVDVDEDVRRLVARVLSSKRYSVAEAASLTASLEQDGANDQYDVILLDLFETSEENLEELERLHEVHPEARLVVMPSFSPDPQLMRRLEERGAVILPKPFSNAQLLRTALGEA